MLTSSPNSPNFNWRGWDRSVNSLRKQNRQQFHSNGMRVDPNGRPTKVNVFGEKLSSPHRGVAAVAELATRVEPTVEVALDKVAQALPVEVKVTPKVPDKPFLLLTAPMVAEERKARLLALGKKALYTYAQEVKLVGRSKLTKVGLVSALLALKG